MNPQFLDVLTEWAVTNSEYFRIAGVTSVLSPRSEGRPKNSQALTLSHADWELSLIVWDSGEAELSSVLHKTGATADLSEHYATPEKMRENLQEWLLKVMTA